MILRKKAIMMLMTIFLINSSFFPIIHGTDFKSESVKSDCKTDEITEWTSLYYINVESNQPWYNILFSVDILHDQFMYQNQLKSDDNHHVLVLQDRRRDPAVIYYMDENCNRNILKEIGEVNLGDPETLINFINYAKNHYQSERYHLAFWSHSNAWFEICTDVSNNKDKLTPDELNQALEETGGVNLLSFIGCCLMGSLEAVYEVKDNCEVYVASESAGNGDDWYGMIDDLCDILNDNTTMDTVEIGERIVDLISNNPNEFHDTLTISAIRTDKIKELVENINELSCYLIENEVSCYHNFLDARNQTKEFTFVNNTNYFSAYKYGYSYLLDLYDFVEHYFEIETDENIKQILMNIKQYLSNTIISECHGINQTGSNGLSIFYSTNDMLTTYSNYKLEFTEHTHWDDLLENHKEENEEFNMVSNYKSLVINQFTSVNERKKHFVKDKTFKNNYALNIPNNEVDQEQTTNDAASCLLGSLLFAQSFKPSLNTVTRVELLLNKIGNLYSNSILSIRESLTGDDLTSAAVNSVDINDDFEWVEFNFPDINVTPGESYYIVLQPDPESDGGEGSNFMSWSFAVENPYPKGNPYVKYSDSWVEGIPGHSSADYTFKTYGYHRNQPPIADAGGPYYGHVNTSVILNGTNSEDMDGIIEFYKWDFGDGQIGSGETPIHTYTVEGEYPVSLTVIDNDGATDTDNTTITIYPENNPPQKPSIPTGENSGKIEVEYTYITSTIDEDNNLLLFKWSWGDGTTSEWMGPYASNETCEAVHSWTEQNNYEIKVKARDEYGLESEWSDPLPVSMPKNNGIDFMIFDILNRLIENFPFLHVLWENYIG